VLWWRQLQLQQFFYNEFSFQLLKKMFKLFSTCACLCFFVNNFTSLLLLQQLNHWLLPLLLPLLLLLLLFPFG